MRSNCRSFDEFWTAFASEQRPFRLGRAGLSLALLAMRQRGRERWRWAVAAAVLTAGKLLAGTFDEELDTRVSEGARPDDPRSLATGEPSRARSAPPVDAAWAAWM
jgi:hypothetical protein